MEIQFLIREDDEFTVDRFDIRDYMKENNLDTIYVLATSIVKTQCYGGGNIYCYKYNTYKVEKEHCDFDCPSYIDKNPENTYFFQLPYAEHYCRYAHSFYFEPDYKTTYKCTLNESKDDIDMETIHIAEEWSKNSISPDTDPNHFHPKVQIWHGGFDDNDSYFEYVDY